MVRDGIVFKDEDGQVIFNQHSFCELVKHLLVELVGISYEEASQIVDRSPLAEPVADAMGVAMFSHDLFYPQIGVKPCSMAGGGVSETIWNCLKTAPAGTGQPLTCSTSGMGLRLKWISMEMCRVLSLSMCSWTTISLIRRFRVAASSSVMSAYS